MMTRREGRMTRVFASMMLASFALYAMFFGVISSVRAVAPTNVVNYQGRLLNASGVPVADATASVSFALYTASSGGTCVWSNSSEACLSVTPRTVTLSDGLFSENLGDTTLATPYAAITDSTFSDNAAIYLEVIVNSETLTPRKRIVAAPYALNASTIDGFNSTQTGGTSALALVLDTNGNLQLTGSPQGTGVGQGSLYINPAAAAIAADEMLFGVAVEGSPRFLVDEDGDTQVGGTLAVHGGSISSNAGLDISSNGGNISFGPNGSGLAYVTPGDDFAVGAGGLNAPFSVDESLNEVRIGDGVNDTNDPKLIMFASDAVNFGALTFTDADTFAFNDANVTMSGSLVVSGNVDANAGLDVAGANFTVGGGNFSVTTGGFLSTIGSAAINGGAISSNSALTLSSSGGNINVDPNGSGLFYVNASDDFAVGANALVAPFSVDESADTVRIGDGVNDGDIPSIVMYASDGLNSGELSFTDVDAFAFTNANVSMSGTLTVAGNVDANAGLDVSGANLTVGGANFSVATGGQLTTVGNAAINGGTLSSTSALAITSSGGNITLDANGTGLVAVTIGDDFAVGAAALLAPFSVDESLNEVRIGDGVNDTNDPKITFYASDAVNSGTLSFADSDTFSFDNGKLSNSYTYDQSTLADGGYSVMGAKGTITGTSAGARNLTLISLGGTSNYSGVLGAGSTHAVIGSNGSTNISNASATITYGIGVQGSVYNQSTNGAAVNGGGYLTGGAFTAQHDSAQTISLMYGSQSTITASQGTVTTGAAVNGDVLAGAGSFTSAFGGRFTNTTEGATRYGIFATASGGATANFAGYFGSAMVQVDADSSADVMTIANAAGDLGISNDLENHGSGRFGDTTGVDDFVFTSEVVNAPGVRILASKLQAGIGLSVERADDASGTTFDGKLVAIDQNDVSAGTGVALNISQQGGGTSTGLYIVQNTLSAHAANATGNNAVVIDVMEDSAVDDNVLIIRSDADNDGAGRDTEFRIESDGDIFGDGATYTSGADYAEFFKTVDSDLGDYHVVCHDPAVANAVRRCAAGETAYVMGVISTNAAFVGNNFRGASYDMSNDPQYRKVGMVGQIDTLVNADEGTIGIGDPITSSATMTGYGAKSHGPTRIIGFALEPLASGTGTIRVLVQPQWYGGDVLASDGTSTVSSANIVMAPMRTATAATSGDSHDLVLRGSGWNGAAAVAKSMTLRNDVADGSETYNLSVVNDVGSQVAYVGETGDLAIAGKLYPSDRGVLQTSKYIYYDGSSGAGGDLMRTNASGWSSGSYDFAEMFPSQDLLAAGEVVVFADQKESIRRSTGTTYDDRIAGVVSTRPAFLAGENRPGDVPVALAGRVPTYVSGENGDIVIGDPLTTSSKAGYAMKATEPGPIVGYAMDSFSGATGVITVFIRPSYFDGNPVEAPIAENAVSGISSVAQLDVSGSMNMNGGSIISIASLAGIGGNWRIMENGDLVTRGSIVALIRSFAGEDVETYAALGREHTVQLSGTAILRKGMVKVEFEKIDPAFNDVISSEVPYRVLVTPAGMSGGVYVAERSNEGFTIRDAANTDDIAVDWLVIAYHKDFAPAMVTPDVIAPEVIEESPPVVPEAIPDTTPEPDPNVVPESPLVDEVEQVPTESEEDIPDTETPVAEDTQPDIAENIEVPVEEPTEAVIDVVEAIPETVAEDVIVTPVTTEDTTSTSTETP